jgi:hypothetical protein
VSGAKKKKVRESLVDPRKVVLPPLHFKLGLMKQSVKASQCDRNCFKHLCSKLPRLSQAKLKKKKKKGSFVGPDTRKFISREMFETTMSNVERKVCTDLEDVISKCLENYRDQNHRKHRKPHAGQIQSTGMQHEPESSFLRLPFRLYSHKSW